MRTMLGGFLVFLLAICAGAQAAEVVYVQGNQAPIYTTPQLSKAPVAVVDQGTPLEVIGHNPRWYHVRGEGFNGWVVKFMVAEHPPAKSQDASQSAKEILLKRARVRPSAFSTTAAARGLRAGDKGLEEAEGVDYESVNRMEQNQPSPEAVTEFFNSEPDHE